MKACAVPVESEETVSLELRVDEIVPDGVYFDRVLPFLGSTLVYSSDFKILRRGYIDIRGNILMGVRISKELAIYKGLLVRDPCKEIETDCLIELELEVYTKEENLTEFVIPGEGFVKVKSNLFVVLRDSCNSTGRHQTIELAKSLAIKLGLCDDHLEKPHIDHINLDLVLKSDSGSASGYLVFVDPYNPGGLCSVWKTDLQILDRYMTTETINGKSTLNNVKMMKIKMTRSKAIEYGLHKDPEVAKPNYIIADSGDGMGNIKHVKSERRFSVSSSPVKDALVGIDYGKVETRLLGNITCADHLEFLRLVGGVKDKVIAKPRIDHYEHDINECSGGIPFVDFIDEFLTNPIHMNTMSDEKYAAYRDSLKLKSREKVNRLRTEFRNFMSGNEK